MTQKEAILKFLDDNKTITPFEAFSELGITKLATRISELKKDGYVFNTETVSKLNRYGRKVSFARYSLMEG